MSKGFLFIYLISLTCLCQTKSDKMYTVAYLETFKPSSTIAEFAKEYSILKIQGENAFYQSYNAMVLDTLRVKDVVTQQDQNKFFSYNTFAIIIKQNKLTYYEDLAGDEYFYEENLNFDWKYHDEEKLINGYNCKKATLTYGGRDWQAWYTLDIPLSFGPYKFKGLPGLIIKMTDSTSSFDFEFNQMVANKNVADVSDKYYHSKPKESRIEMSRNNFNKLKYRYNSLSLNDRIRFRNTEGGRFKLVQLDESGNEKKEFRSSSSASFNNFIEIDHN